jgi:hypothetical protein
VKSLNLADSRINHDGKRPGNTQCEVTGVSIRQVVRPIEGESREEYEPTGKSHGTGSVAARNSATAGVDMRVALTYCLLKIPAKSGESIEFLTF